MLKIGLLLALGAMCVAAGEDSSYTRRADMDYMYKQKKIYDLLLNVRQRDVKDAEFYNIGMNFTFKDEMFRDKSPMQQCRNRFQQGLYLQRDSIYSPYNSEQIEETKLLFDLLYSAKDFETFYQTACWARLNLNSGVFTSAFTAAIFYRPDCKYMRPPPIYEMYPNLFFDSRVIQQAQRLRLTPEMKNQMCTIYANYSGKYEIPSSDMESKLDYFMEDINLNAFYYYFQQAMPYWLSESVMSQEYKTPKNIRGQLYYYIHKQLIARYYLERMSNDLGDIEDFDWYRPIYPGFQSQMMYSTGDFIPQREEYSMVPCQKFKYLKEIDMLESRIMNAIDLGYVINERGKQINIYTPEGLNTLANLIEGNVNSCNKRFYGKYDSLARNILGFSLDYKNKDSMIPSALQCYGMSMRDPAFYMLYKRIMTYFLRFKKYQPMYTENDLILPGVEFKSVEVSELKTFFGTCSSLGNSAQNGLIQNLTSEQNVPLRICRPCLKYQPFTYKMNINSDKKMEAVLRIFLGPAYSDVDIDAIYLQKYYYNFVEMDKFNVKLQSGANEITRSSSDSYITMPDMEPSDMFYNKLIKGISGGEPLSYSDKLFGFVERLTLPKGKPEGMKYKMFFFLNEMEQNEMYDFPMFGKIMFDGKPLGFPLDRPMQLDWKLNVNIPNMYFKNIYIYNDPKMKE